MCKTFLFFLLVNITFSISKAQENPVKVYENNLVLHGDSAVFPLTVINAFPFISGEVNGTKGKFMFDTGNQSAIELNDHLIVLTNKIKSGSGIVGSGQTFTVNNNDTIREIKLGDSYVYRKVLNVASANYDFLEGITPDCLGYIGYKFFKGYIFKLDYLRRKVTFYKATQERLIAKDFLKEEKILAVIKFTTRRLPNHPILDVTIGGLDIIGAFDTGQYGSLQIDEPSKRILLKQALIINSGTDNNESKLLTLKNVNLAGSFVTDLYGVADLRFEDVAPIRKGLQITEPNYISFGYRFLAEYKTVWDYKSKEIYILKK